jgi:hypothetical protein
MNDSHQQGCHNDPTEPSKGERSPRCMTELATPQER